MDREGPLREEGSSFHFLLTGWNQDGLRAEGCTRSQTKSKVTIYLPLPNKTVIPCSYSETKEHK
jgi:hypothetical protein